MRIKSAILALLISFFSSVSPLDCGARERDLLAANGPPAPELDGGAGWLNTDTPLHLKDLSGKIVLLDFWTFCCINCMHIFPDLKKLEEKYPNELVVIGVHSAKFENERDTSNIRKAILRYGITHPVLNDSKFEVWQAYGVNSWPTLILIAPDRRVAGVFAGEGNYQKLDAAIAGLISSYGKIGKLDRQPLSLTLEKNKFKQQPLMFPGKITSDPKGGRLFISDSGHNRIIVCNQNGQLLSVIGSGQVGQTDGDFVHARFNHPQGLAYRNDQLYVADTENHLIRLVDLKGKKVTTVAGTGKQGSWKGGGGPAATTALSSPWDLVLIGDKAFIAMAGRHQIWELDLKKHTVEPFAGNGRENIVDGTLSSASLAQPSGITTDGGTLYIADSEVSAVRRAGISNAATVSTVVGRGLFDFGDKDGVGKAVRLQHPLGILWLDGKLYVADSYNHKIKKIDPLSEKSDTFLGNGKPGLEDGRNAQFSEPGGLTAVGRKLFIADTNNHVIRVADLDTKQVTTLRIQNLKPPSAQ